MLKTKFPRSKSFAACALLVGAMASAWAGGGGGAGGGFHGSNGGGGGGGLGSSGGNGGGWAAFGDPGAGGLDGAGGSSSGNGGAGLFAPPAPSLRGGPAGLSGFDGADVAGAAGGAGGVGSAGGGGGTLPSYTGGGGGGGADGRDCGGGVQTGYAGGGGGGGLGDPGASGGGGGGGGAGARIGVNGVSCNLGTLTGGAGGAGGSAGAGRGGGGGGGGSGLFVSATGTDLTVTGATGGNGGNGGAGGIANGAGGEPGAGITVTGNGNIIRVSGTIAPGVGAAIASAVTFDGTTNNVLDMTGATLNGGARLFGAGNTLRGTGSITSSLLLDNGILAPGHSIGTITVTGAASLPGITYNAEIDAAAGTADLLDVIGAPGTATITGATLNISNLAGTPAVGQTYMVLRTVGGITGAFTLGSLPAGVTASLSYPGGLSAVLTITGYVPPVTTGIPTLSEYGMLALASLLAFFGLRATRRRYD